MASQKKSDYDHMVKILIIGDSGVGKTCMLMRFCENTFTINHLTTIGIDFKLKTIQIDDKKVKMQIWDTAGQERFRTITQTYYKGANGIMLTYGVDDRVSFINIENWMKQIKLHAQENVQKILVGNKQDTTDRVVSTHEGQKLADEYGMQFFETSAKTGDNIHKIFETMAQLSIYDQTHNTESNLDQQMNKNINQKLLLNGNSKTQQKSGCC